MPVKPDYPGVYIEEIPSGVHAITGVATSIALFIGRAARGPMDQPTLCLSFSDFSRAFGTDARYGDLPRSVRLFFENGGAQCYVMRIANGATAATVTLKSEAGADVLTLTAKEKGLIGETIRAAVTYAGLNPESGFTLELFRWETDARGQQVKQGQEIWPNLTMNPLSARYAPLFLTQNSQLVSASAVTPLAPPYSPPVPGVSQAGRAIPYDSATPATLRDAWAALIGNAVSTNHFQISVAGTAFTDVDLTGIDVGALGAATVAAFHTNLAGAIQSRINGILPAGVTVAVDFTTLGPAPAPGTPATGGGTADTTSLLRITCATGDVLIQPATSGDVAVLLMLGAPQGGLEVSGYAGLRPAPTGISYKATTDIIPFAALPQDAFNAITIGGTSIPLGTSLQTVAPVAPITATSMYMDGNATSSNGNNDGVREKFGLIQQAINAFAAANPTFGWKAQFAGQRLTILPTTGGDNSVETIATTGGATDIGGRFNTNVRYYSLGASGTGAFQTPAPAVATDGSKPLAGQYAAAYDVVDREVDLFNLLILPTDREHTEAETATLWGPASIFCQTRRAFLLMDAPDWSDVQTATHPVNGVNSLRVGLVKDYAALYYPRLKIVENGLDITVGPSGAIAGLIARIDGARGVWKAPAGMEADLRGITGINRRFSDRENGVLNPHAINTLRAFPAGIVCWGARTMDGDDDFGSEWKYVPIRRLALFLEESLYRGTQWAVFEPNDEPLWSQIRLNVGAFMQSLFRQGAFQGHTPKDAYFVKCDAETTTQTDRNLGIVNVVVGFAPLNPAEFVIIQIQQIAGQIPV